MITLQKADVMRDGHRLVGPVTLDLEPGRTTVVVGPNGAGKSTLLKLLSGHLRPSAGRATLDGAPLHAMRPEVLAGRREVLGQSTEAGFGFTVHEIAELGLRTLGRQPSRERRAQLVERVLATIGLLQLADRPLARLSGGERRRAHFARVLVQLHAGQLLYGPGALLLDEPIAAQDLSHQLRILSLARSTAGEGTTVAIILHDLNWACCVADRLVVLHHGGIYADGRPEDVLTETMLTEVFDVALTPRALPPTGTPFVLPQVAVPSAARRL